MANAVLDAGILFGALLVASAVDRGVRLLWNRAIKYASACLR
jgi:hypothetical protein